MKNIKIALRILLAAALALPSCNYLDVVPPEQADLDDMMKDNNAVINNLYSCYGYIQNNGLSPMSYSRISGGGADEVVCPQEWGNLGQMAQWNSITPSTINNNNSYPWFACYNAIGYCNQFLKQLDELNPDITAAEKQQYVAEVQFLKAYYHFRVLELYGPCPIIDELLSQNIAKSDIPGRSHFDYCVDYIVNLLDEAATVLPDTYTLPDDFGRATSVACKALKARVLLLAASPIWNGSFPDRYWKNTNYETPGYGKDLVSQEYDATKWQKAKTACEEAISLAEDSGYKLYTMTESEQQRQNLGMPLPQIPGNSISDDFKKRVMMYRFMMTATPDEGNKEMLWGMYFDSDIYRGSIPHFVIENNLNNRIGWWGGLSPTLYTVEHFFTNNGKIPSEDADFTPESDWFKSAGLSNSDIINLNVNREARFYAWISFDGDEYSPVISAKKPLIMKMRDPQEGGYNSALWGTRNYCVTGFLNKKWVHPNYYFTGISWGTNNPRFSYAIIRLSELYLDLAECDAQLGNTADALKYLNVIRDRAGIPEWTESSLASIGKSVLSAVLEERFVELYMEGFRYFDIRRYLQGRSTMSSECYMGLDAVKTEPTFSEFNTPTHIDQPFTWNDRMYLMPIPNKENYSNPQMVQAPGY